MAGFERNEILLPSDEQKARLPGGCHTPNFYVCFKYELDGPN